MERIIFSLVPLEIPSFFSPNEREREITRYMHLSEQPKENRITIDFAELFE